MTNIACSRSDSVSPDGCFHDRTITYTAFDACGNASTNAVQHITWTTDTTPPTFVVCPGNTNLGVNPSSIPDCDLSPGHVVAEDGQNERTLLHAGDQRGGGHPARADMAASLSYCLARLASSVRSTLFARL